jgi:TRAP-type C4-dicarboxylate transport system substrate-binding protein
MRLCLLCLAFLSLLLPAGSADAQQIELKANLQVPIFANYGVSLMRFKEEVEKRTNGERIPIPG